MEGFTIYGQGGISQKNVNNACMDFKSQTEQLFTRMRMRLLVLDHNGDFILHSNATSIHDGNYGSPLIASFIDVFARKSVPLVYTNDLGKKTLTAGEGLGRALSSKELNTKYDFERYQKTRSDTEDDFRKDYGHGFLWLKEGEIKKNEKRLLKREHSKADMPKSFVRAAWEGLMNPAFNAMELTEDMLDYIISELANILLNIRDNADYIQSYANSRVMELKVKKWDQKIVSI